MRADGDPLLNDLTITPCERDLFRPSATIAYRALGELVRVPLEITSVPRHMAMPSVIPTEKAC